MTNNKRAALAFVFGTKGQNGNASCIYGLDDLEFHHFIIQWNMSEFTMFDSERNRIFSGNESLIFDFKTTSFINISYCENFFSGYDFKTGYQFNGIVSGNRVSIYDSEFSKYFDYTLPSVS